MPGLVDHDGEIPEPCGYKIVSFEQFFLAMKYIGNVLYGIKNGMRSEDGIVGLGGWKLYIQKRIFLWRVRS